MGKSQATFISNIPLGKEDVSNKLLLDEVTISKDSIFHNAREKTKGSHCRDGSSYKLNYRSREVEQIQALEQNTINISPIPKVNEFEGSFQLEMSPTKIGNLSLPYNETKYQAKLPTLKNKYRTSTSRAELRKYIHSEIGDVSQTSFVEVDDSFVLDFNNTVSTCRNEVNFMPVYTEEIMSNVMDFSSSPLNRKLLPEFITEVTTTTKKSHSSNYKNIDKNEFTETASSITIRESNISFLQNQQDKYHPDCIGVKSNEMSMSSYGEKNLLKITTFTSRDLEGINYIDGIDSSIHKSNVSSNITVRSSKSFYSNGTSTSNEVGVQFFSRELSLSYVSSHNSSVSTLNEDLWRTILIEHQKQTKPLNAYAIDSIRVCICDMEYKLYRKCADCSKNNPYKCYKHATCKCFSCLKLFHVQCVGWELVNNFPFLMSPKWKPTLYRSTTGFAIMQYKPWQCHICWEKNKTIENISWMDCSLNDLALRFGIVKIPSQSDRTFKRDIMEYAKHVKKIIPSNIYSALVNSYPQSYNPMVPMNNSSLKDHVIHGRRFETTLLLFESRQCSCCGTIKPEHNDKLYKKYTYYEPLKRSHLATKMKPAWKCTCDAVCKGEQFYSASRKKELEWYFLHHSKTPWEYLGLPKTKPNALLCNNCNQESPRVIGE